MKEVLNKSGVFNEVDVAEEGNSALEKLKNKKYDILLTDINMPNGMEGFELVDIVQKEEYVDNIFIFSGNVENLDKSLNLDIKGFYKKPITDIKDFIDEIVSKVG